MSKRTIGLIIVLIIAAGLLFSIALSPKKTPPAQKQITATPTPPAQTTLSLYPNPLFIPASPSSIDVIVDSRDNDLTAVQLELSYDPKALTSVDVVPGSFFEEPVELLKNIDTQKGKISYALAISPAGTPKKGYGVVAKITFRSLLAPGQKTQITPLSKTLVTASSIAPSVLKEAQGTTIIYSQQNPTESASTPKGP